MNIRVRGRLGALVVCALLVGGLVMPSAAIAAPVPFSCGFENGLGPEWYRIEDQSGVSDVRSASGSYSLFVDSQMYFGPFDFPSGSKPKLEFDIWYDFNGDEQFEMWVNVGGPTEPAPAGYFVQPRYIGGSSGGWKHVVMDLTSIGYFGSNTMNPGDQGQSGNVGLAGENDCWLMFNHSSPWFGTEPGEGVWIDNVRVTCDGSSVGLGTGGSEAAIEPPVPVTEVAGANRIETAVKASEAVYDQTDWVVIATAYNFPDALGGSSLAGVLEAPMLLTDKNTLPGAVSAEIARLKAKNAIVLGSEAAVGANVFNQLAAQLGGADNVQRIGGADRYETAALIAQETVASLKDNGRTYDGQVYIATGENFPDALAAAPVAAAKGRPILLTRRGTWPASSDAAFTAIGAKSPWIIGSTAVVGEPVIRAVGAKSGNAVGHLAGGTRYQTAIKVAEHGVADGLTWDGVAFATGTNYPDALSGGVMQGAWGSVMLLTQPTACPSEVKAMLGAHKDEITGVTFLGSLSAINQTARNGVYRALQ